MDFTKNMKFFSLRIVTVTVISRAYLLPSIKKIISFVPGGHRKR